MASIFFNYLFFFYKKKKFEFDKEKTFHQTKRVGKNYREKYALFTHFSLICVCVCNLHHNPSLSVSASYVSLLDVCCFHSFAVEDDVARGEENDVIVWLFEKKTNKEKI